MLLCAYCDVVIQPRFNFSEIILNWWWWTLCVCVGGGGGGWGGGGERKREREADRDGDWERRRMHLRSASAPHTHHHPSHTAPPVCRSLVPLTELGLWISCGKKEKQAVCTPTSISRTVCGPTLLKTGCSSTSSEMAKVASVKAATFPTVSQCQSKNFPYC